MSEALAGTELDVAPRRLTTVVAADICGYSRLAEIDDDAAIRTVNFVRAAFERVVARRRGRLFHTAGDGFLAEFPSAADGVLAALEFVADIKGRDKLSPINPGAQVRAGVHAGDVIEQPGGDLLGHGVNVAARLQAEAEPGGVLVSQAAVNLTNDKFRLRFDRVGPINLKNMAGAVVAFEANTEGRRPPLVGFLKSKRKFLGRAVAATCVGVFFAATIVFAIDGLIGRRERAQLNAAAARELETQQTEIRRISASVLARQHQTGETAYSDAVDVAISSLLNSATPEKAAAADLIRAGRVTEGAELLTQIAKQQESENAPQASQIETLKQVGALLRFANTPRAKAAYLEVLEMRPDSDTTALMQLADIALDVPDADTARNYFERLETLALRNGDRRLQAEALIGIGRTQTRLRRLEQAETTFLRALAIAERERWPAGRARCLLYLASAAFLGNDFAGAENYAREANALERGFAEPARDAVRIMHTHITLGSVLKAKGDLPGAEKEYDAALAMAEGVDDPRSIAMTLYNLGNLKLAQEKPLESEKLLGRALMVLASADGMSNLKAHIHAALALAATERGDDGAACAHVKSAKAAYATTAHSWPSFEQNLSKIACT